MLFGKRKREDEGDDVREPIKRILEEVVKWRDPCGRAYKVVHKVELHPDKVRAPSKDHPCARKEGRYR